MSFVVVGISLAALLALAGLFQFWGSRNDKRAFPPPGRMIDIGGRKLHARVPQLVMDAIRRAVTR